LCFTHRLIVEVDGGQHADGAQLESDSRRDGVFAQAGFLTHRVWNHEVNEDVGEVVEGIVLMLRARPPTRPLRVHPPHEGEGG
jgi:very-short-patch-repair endonuclease